MFTYLLFTVTGIHEEGNHRLQPAHLTVPLLQKDSSSKANSRKVSCSCLHYIPVVIPGSQAVEDLVEQWGPGLQLCSHALPLELHQLVNRDAAEWRTLGV